MAIDYSITKSYDMYFRDFYSIDRNASKSEQRASYKTNKLAKADSSAMTKISKTLRKMDFSQDNGNDIFYTVKSFVNAYNNLMESSGSSNEYDISHPEKFIKSLTKDQEKALSDIGITISASGKLKLDEDKLMETKPAKIGKLFSEDSEFTKKINFYANKIYRASNRIDVTLKVIKLKFKTNIGSFWDSFILLDFNQKVPIAFRFCLLSG